MPGRSPPVRRCRWIRCTRWRTGANCSEATIVPTFTNYNGYYAWPRTVNYGTNAFQNEWLQIKINLPSDYTCNESANPTTTGGSCWWQIKYVVQNGAALSDYTTWTARIEGDPVRLTQ